jgi:hypothetical protein
VNQGLGPVRDSIAGDSLEPFPHLLMLSSPCRSGYLGIGDVSHEGVPEMSTPASPRLTRSLRPVSEEMVSRDVIGTPLRPAPATVTSAFPGSLVRDGRGIRELTYWQEVESVTLRTKHE